MLASSSKRALISTSTTTCLPRSAARIRFWTIGRVARRPVQRLLDRQDVGIVGRLRDEPLDGRRERLVRVVDEQVARPDLREQVDRLAVLVRRQPRRDDRRVGRRLEVGAVEVDELPQGGEVEHPGDLVHVVVEHADALAQDPSGHLGHRPLDLEPDRLAEAAAPDLLLDREQEVVGLVLLDRDVGVAGDAEQVGLEDLHAPEQLVEVRLDDLVEQHEPAGVDLHQARQERRDLDPREPLLPGVGVAEPDGDRQGEGADVRERVPGVHRERRQHRVDLVVEALAQGVVVVGDVVVVEDRDPLGGELPMEVREDRALLGDELHHPRPDRVELVGGRPAVGGQRLRAAQLLAPQARDPRTWKNSSRLLTKKNSDRTRSRSGLRSSPRLVEHARVELEPRELAVEDRVSLLARRPAAAAGGSARSGCGANGGHGPRNDADRTRDAGATTPRPDPGRAAENTTPPIANRSGGPPIRAPERRLSRSATYRRSPVVGSRNTRIWTPVVGSTNRSSVGRNRGSGGAGSLPPGPCVIAGSVGGQRAVSQPLEDGGDDQDHARQDQEQDREDVAARSRRVATTRPATTRTTPSPPISPRASVTPIGATRCPGARRRPGR